jgi:diguanylate cyclase (GGDEF)-like protein
MTVTTMLASGVLIEILLRRLRTAALESSDQASRLAAVGEVAHEIAQQTVSSATAPTICRATSEVTGASCAALLEPTADGGGLRVVASTEPSKTGQVVLLGGPRSGAVQAFASAKPVFLSGTDGTNLDPMLVGAGPEASALFQPILREGNPIGVLAVRWNAPIGNLSEGAEATLSLLATEASIAITRAQLLDRLEHAAHTDDLTGTYNRRAWNEELDREISRSKRTGHPLTVAILDLDRFKEFNDGHGHQAGDRMLRRITALWRERIRPTDVLARYGGDEFALALADCPADGAEVLIDRLRDALPAGQTISGGFATWDGRESAEALLDRADAALYEAKQNGRDRVVG